MSDSVINVSGSDAVYPVDTRLVDSDHRQVIVVGDGNVSAIASVEADTSALRVINVTDPIEVALGHAGPNHTRERKFGYKAVVGSTREHIWTTTGDLLFLEAASALVVSSSNTNDVSGGTGARELYLTCITSAWEQVTIHTQLNGTNAVSLSGGPFLRVQRMYVDEVGVHLGSNSGTITCGVAGGGFTQAEILPGIGQTEKTQYTVPLNCQAVLLRVAATVASNKEANISVWQRANNGAYAGTRLVHRWVGVTSVDEPMPSMEVFSEKTDIWISGSIATTGSISGVLYFFKSTA